MTSLDFSKKAWGQLNMLAETNRFIVASTFVNYSPFNQRHEVLSFGNKCSTVGSKGHEVQGVQEVCDISSTQNNSQKYYN